MAVESQFDLGEIVRNTHDGFEAWDLPLDDAISQIAHAHVTNFDDRWRWTAYARLQLTENGKALALQLYHADNS